MGGVDETQQAMLAQIGARWSGVRVLDRFLVQRCVHVSAGCAILQGWDIRQDGLVAIKIPRERAESYPNLEREARALQEIEHHKGPALLGTEIIAGRLAIVTEWIAGERLDALIQQRAGVTRTQFYHTGQTLAHDLAVFHEQGFAFLNLNPTHVMILEGTRLIDFGEVRHCREPDPDSVEGGDIRAADILALSTTLCAMIDGAWREGDDLPTHFVTGERVPSIVLMLLERGLGAPAERPIARKFASTLKTVVSHALKQRLPPKSESSMVVSSTEEWARESTRPISGTNPALQTMREGDSGEHAFSNEEKTKELLVSLLEEKERDELRETFDNPTMRERMIAHMREEHED